MRPAPPATSATPTEPLRGEDGHIAVWQFGGMIGLGLVGLLADRFGGHALVVAGLAALPVLFAPLLFVLPETHKRELEKTWPTARGTTPSGG